MWKRLVSAFNQEEPLVGAFSVIMYLRVDIRFKLYCRYRARTVCLFLSIDIFPNVLLNFTDDLRSNGGNLIGFKCQQIENILFWDSVKTDHTCPGDLSTSMWVCRDNSTFPQHYSHVWWRIGVSQKFSPGNFCTFAKISGEFAKALKMTFFGLKTIYNFIIHTKE